jgi:transketolase
LTADNGGDFDAMFIREFPDRYYNVGIAEQNMVGVAIGLASEGKIPFVSTAAAFLAYRANEFVRSACFLKSHIIGLGLGLGWAPLGPTHHGTEDVGALRSFPNLSIYSPATPIEMNRVILAAYATDGPVYVRMGMGGEHEYFDENYIFEPGKLCEPFKFGADGGAKITIFSSSSVLANVIPAAERLSDVGFAVTVANVSSLKPIDVSGVSGFISDSDFVITAEEHNIIGGLGTIVSEIIATEGLRVPFARIGLEDSFAVGYGSEEEVRAMNGLNAEGIYVRIMDAIAKMKGER